MKPFKVDLTYHIVISLIGEGSDVGDAEDDAIQQAELLFANELPEITEFNLEVIESHPTKLEEEDFD